MKMSMTKWIGHVDTDDNELEKKYEIPNKGRTNLGYDRYNQAKGIDYEKTCAHVECLEAIRLLLTFVFNLIFYQIDVKYAFLKEFINEKVNVYQNMDFEDHENPHFVFKLKWAQFGFKHTLRVWYGRLSGFFINKEFNRGNMDTNLFIKSKGTHILLF